MRLIPCLVVLSCVALLAGCGDGNDPSGGSDRNAQANLDAVTREVEPTLAALEEVEGDEEDTEALLEAFGKQLESMEGVERVERPTDWTLEDPLPCGDDPEPDQRVLASGPDDDLFIGVASSEYVAGFAESGGDDLGVVVAECRGGDSGDLHVASVLEPDGDAGTVSVVSFEDADAARALRKRLQGELQGEGPSPGEAIHLGAWSRGDQLICADGPDARTIVSDDASDVYLHGVASDALVVAFLEQDGEDLGLFAARCEDGAAKELRLLALPLDEARELQQ